MEFQFWLIQSHKEMIVEGKHTMKSECVVSTQQTLNRKNTYKKFPM